MKRIVVLGSTGSIGTQTLDVIRKMPEEFQVVGLAAGGSRLELLRDQILEFRPATVAVWGEKEAAELKASLAGKRIRILCGMEGIREAASLPEADMVVAAMVGMIGIEPTVEALRRGKTVALANKETLVCAGEYIMGLSRQYNAPILPVDSEHCAVFQCLQGVRAEQVDRILLTASGGPFRGWTREKMENITPAQALKHPNWTMGAKITVDSATLMNKGLEMIEARWLFDQTRIEPVIHPQSIVHSLVELVDGTVLAQLGVPDMRLPIEVALLYPERGIRVAAPLNLTECGPLTFEKIDEQSFPSVAMARYVLKRGGLFPAVYNAANEKAVGQFLRGEISFTDIFSRVETALNEYEKKGGAGKSYTLEEVLAVRQFVDAI